MKFIDKKLKDQNNYDPYQDYTIYDQFVLQRDSDILLSTFFQQHMESTNLNLLEQLEEDDKMEQTPQSCSQQANTMPTSSPVEIVSEQTQKEKTFAARNVRPINQ